MKITLATGGHICRSTVPPKDLRACGLACAPRGLIRRAISRIRTPFMLLPRHFRVRTRYQSWLVAVPPVVCVSGCRLRATSILYRAPAIMTLHAVPGQVEATASQFIRACGGLAYWLQDFRQNDEKTAESKSVRYSTIYNYFKTVFCSLVS